MLNIQREMEAYRTAIAQRGLSWTRQRQQLGELVFSSHGHFTIDDLTDLARKARIRVGRVTVYRTLNLMVDAGLVEERPFERGRMRYEHTIGHSHHDHMVCVDCGKVIEFESPSVEREQKKAAARARFTILHHSHTLFGRCWDCERSPRKPSRATYERSRSGQQPTP